MNWTRDDERRLRIALAVGLGFLLYAAVLAAAIAYIYSRSAAAPRAADPLNPGAATPPDAAPGLTLSRTAGSVPVGGLLPPRAPGVQARGRQKTMGGCSGGDRSPVPGADRNPRYPANGRVKSSSATSHGEIVSPVRKQASRPSLLHAIRLVESGGRPNPPRGDGGRARGPYQIWRAYWLDARMPSGTWADCDRRAYAERVILAYWRRWCPKALASGDWRTLANVHHLGGPANRRGETDEAYLAKVKAVMLGERM